MLGGPRHATVSRCSVKTPLGRVLVRPSSMKKHTTASSISQPRALVLLDRDGVINTDVGSPGVLTERDFTLVPGAAKAVAKLKRNGAVVCVVTNQTCVGKGLIDESRLDSIHAAMRALLAEQGGDDATIDDIFAATHTEDQEQSRDGPERLKPAPGMVLEALTRHGFGANLGSVTFVGDTVTDMQAAYRAGVVNRITVGTGYGAEVYQALCDVIDECRQEDERDDELLLGKEVFIVNTTEDDPSSTLAPETLPLTVCADIVQAVEVIVQGMRE